MSVPCICKRTPGRFLGIPMAGSEGDDGTRYTLSPYVAYRNPGNQTITERGVCPICHGTAIFPPPGHPYAPDRVLTASPDDQKRMIDVEVTLLPPRKEREKTTRLDLGGGDAGSQNS